MEISGKLVSCNKIDACRQNDEVFDATIALPPIDWYAIRPGDEVLLKVKVRNIDDDSIKIENIEDTHAWFDREFLVAHFPQRELEKEEIKPLEVIWEKQRGRSIIASQPSLTEICVKVNQCVDAINEMRK